MSYYSKLKNDLAKAAAEGIITSGQADKVWDSSYSSRPFASFRAAHWIAAAAGLFVAMGLVLIVASNWDKIGPLTKMASFLLLFWGTAEAALRLEERPAAAIPLETIWFFMPALGIGLYAQIFNLSGDPVKPYLLWAALAAPLALLSKRPLAAYLTSILLMATLFWGTLGSSNILALASGYGAGAQAQPLWHWALALAALASAIYIYPGKKLGMPLGAAAVWLFFMLAADTAVKLRSPALLLLAGMSLAALWLSYAHSEEGKPGLPLTVWTAAVYIMTFFWHFKESDYYNGSDTAAGGAIAWLLFAAALLSVFLRRQRMLPEGKQEDMAAKTLLTISMLCAFLLFEASPASAKVMAVIANLILAGFGASCIISGARHSDEKLINRGVLVITLTAITRFVDIFGSMLKSGMAFIVTGLAFGALAYFVNKGRKALIESVKK